MFLKLWTNFGGEYGRAENSSRRITLEDVPIIKGMLLRGDRHDIASWFGVNAAKLRR